jgi:hypothetical protein
MGQFLRATMLRWEDERVRLSAEVKRTGSVGANALICAAFEVAVRRWFTRGLDLREISGFAADMRRAFGPEVPMLEVDALIRGELGDEVSTDDIDIRQEIGAKVLTLCSVADLLDRDEAAVNAILIEAEAIAKERGFQPTLVV